MVQNPSSLHYKLVSESRSRNLSPSHAHQRDVRNWYQKDDVLDSDSDDTVAAVSILSMTTKTNSSAYKISLDVATTCRPVTEVHFESCDAKFLVQNTAGNHYTILPKCLVAEKSGTGMDDI